VDRAYPCLVTALEQPTPPVGAAIARADRVREIGAFLALGTGLSAVYVLSGHRIGMPCPFKLITGWDCPLCGGTRMGASLMHGDVPAAFHYNPLALIGLTGLGLGWLVLLAHRAGIVKGRLPDVSKRARRVLKIAGLVVIVAFTVARNLTVGPLAGWRV
jgi:Protein of unknown function (DUF2752)